MQSGYDIFWRTADYHDSMNESLHVISVDIIFKVLVIVEQQEGDGDFSQISSEENELDDELPSNMVSVCLF